MTDKKWRYEFTFITSPKLTKEKQRQLLAKIKAGLKKMQGEAEEEKSWGEKEFSYQIKGYSKGDYFFWQVAFSKAPQLSSINMLLNREKDILRYLWVKSKEG